MNTIHEAMLFAYVNGRLELVQATKQEKLLGSAMAHYLLKLVRAYSRTGKEQVTETKLLGNISYRELTTGRGKKRHTLHYVSFVDEDYALHYEELRHALQIAVFSMVGEPVSLQVDLQQKTAVWRFLAGTALSDVVRV